MTSGFRNSVSLTTVLGDVAVDEANNVRANGGLEDGGDLDGNTRFLTVQTKNGYNRERSLLENKC